MTENRDYEEISEKLRSRRESYRERILEMELEDLRVSLQDAKLFGIREPEELIRWSLYNRFGRSSAPMRARILEDIVAKLAEGEILERKDHGQLDFILRRNDQTYLVKIKLSLDPLSARRVMDNLEASKEKLSEEYRTDEVKIVLGSPQRTKEKEKVQEYFEGDEIFTGLDFWRFITQDDYIDEKVIELFSPDLEDGRPLSELIEEKALELAKEWRAEYGDELVNQKTIDRFF